MRAEPELAQHHHFVALQIDRDHDHDRTDAHHIALDGLAAGQLTR